MIKSLATIKNELTFTHCYDKVHAADIFHAPLKEAYETLQVSNLNFYSYCEEEEIFSLEVKFGELSPEIVFPAINDVNVNIVKNNKYSIVAVRRGAKLLGVLTIDTDEEEKLDYLLTLSGLMGHPLHQWLKSKNLEQPELSPTKEKRPGLKPKNIIGNSKAMFYVYSLMEKVIDSPSTVLVYGESGVGKEKVANEIHELGPRKTSQFVSVNCAALPRDLIESELFGHEQGAFTGATQTRIGKFEQAHGGTLFLDEISELPLEAQAKLLRALQEKVIVKVGSNRSVNCDVRIIAATNKDLLSQVKKGEFREDLYYRLNVFPINIPPLRERKADILLLANYFVENFSKENGKSINRISTSAIDMLMQYHYPGNVRELSNCIERAVLLCDGSVILGSDLPPTLQTDKSLIPQAENSIDDRLARIEKELIVDALKQNRGHLGKSAKSLGITERKLGLRVKKFKISTANYKHKFYTNVESQSHSTFQ